MKISLIQNHPFTADLNANIADHLKYAKQCADLGVELLLFPELSLTGYEPTLAAELALEKDDLRLQRLQEFSDEHHVTLGVGLPLRSPEGICISLLFFRPGLPVIAHHKQYLHPDEEPYFSSGPNLPGIIVNGIQFGLAICYELSVDEQLQEQMQYNPAFYLTSVAKAPKGLATATTHLAQIARKYNIITGMANSVGAANGTQCMGNTAVWDSGGHILGLLNQTDAGMMVFNTVDRSCNAHYFNV
ncbi:carbon-nitrogen hydrolase family protein [Zeaxanthinibacter sp. PT1]|uniref:carbon-nitrogen hydrolase family protein n=1 Tax=Zeaxanthinibacter TaxID=561554 RepID=UPI00234A0562|nr:carbon-nitrogen hydrolase family protein [Zeaxanthinibacter sp. PT1]MDC6350932.1 carbon-nitrogen hydrolase family protein [Zeaxanthinibacter sp. PT1]